MNSQDKFIFRDFIHTLQRFGIPTEGFEQQKWAAIAAAAWGTKNV